LLTGDLIYSSNDLGPKQFRVGKGGVESGLEEVILFLKKGKRDSDLTKFLWPISCSQGRKYEALYSNCMIEGRNEV
jgi:hypothetical protein